MLVKRYGMKKIFISFYLFVVLVILATQVFYGSVLDQLILKIAHKDITNYYQELSRGMFHLMIAKLEKTDERQWSEQMAAWQPEFGFPIALRRLEDDRFTSEERHQLTSGAILIPDNGRTYYKRIGTSNQVLRLGGTQNIIQSDSLATKIKIMVWIVAPTFLCLLALLWAFPFWIKLRQIRSAAYAFGQGNWITRAEMPRHSILSPVAAAFNTMADRIQKLINSNREIIRAVSHELRTPVARIRFHLEMLTDAKDNSVKKDHIDGIQKDIDELSDLIDELLTYARFESGQPGISPHAFPLAAWLTELVAYNEVELEGFAFRMHNALDDPTASVYFDPKQMGRAVSNLLRNAAKYARLRIQLTIARQNDLIYLHIDDDGPGIPTEEREHVFEPFTRLDQSRSRDSGGHGLGLAIVKRVAQWHQGQVDVTQNDFGGARFTLCWPGSRLPSTGEG
jgi:signal transduction histidine kinase